MVVVVVVVAVQGVKQQDQHAVMVLKLEIGFVIIHAHNLEVKNAKDTRLRTNSADLLALFMVGGVNGVLGPDVKGPVTTGKRVGQELARTQLLPTEVLIVEEILTRKALAVPHVRSTEVGPNGVRGAVVMLVERREEDLDWI